MVGTVLDIKLPNLMIDMAGISRMAKYARRSSSISMTSNWPYNCSICKIGCVNIGLCNPCNDAYKRGLVSKPKRRELTVEYTCESTGGNSGGGIITGGIAFDARISDVTIG